MRIEGSWCRGLWQPPRCHLSSSLCCRGNLEIIFESFIKILTFSKFPRKRNFDVPARPIQLLLGGRFEGFVNYDESNRLEKLYRNDPTYVFEKKFFKTADANSDARVGNYHIELSVRDSYGTIKGKVKKLQESDRSYRDKEGERNFTVRRKRNVRF